MWVELTLNLGRPIFHPAGAIEQHHLIGFLHAPTIQALLVSGIGRGALGAEQQPSSHAISSSAAWLASSSDSDGEAATFAYRTQDQEIADRLRHPNP